MIYIKNNKTEVFQEYIETNPKLTFKSKHKDLNYTVEELEVNVQKSTKYTRNIKENKNKRQEKVGSSAKIKKLERNTKKVSFSCCIC